MIWYLDDSGLLKRNGENRWDSFFVFPYVVMTGGLPRMTMIFTPSMLTFRRLKWMRLDTPCQRLERNDGFDVENYFKGDRFELCSISAYLIWYHRSHTYLISIISTCIISYGIYHSLHEWTQLDAMNRRDMHVLFLFLGNRYSNSRCRKERFESLWDAENVPVHPGNWRGVWSDPSKRMSNWVQARSILEKNNQVGHWTYAVGFVAIFEWRKVRVPTFWNTASWNTCRE